MPLDRDLRDRLLRAVWTDIRRQGQDDVERYPAAARAVASGADPADLALTMMAARYEMAFSLLYLLTGEGVEPGNYSAATGWALATVRFVDDDPVVVGTDDLNMLFEELLSADPTGLEGSDFLS